MRTLLSMVGFTVLASCSSLGDSKPETETIPSKGTVWVAKDFLGGVQCDLEHSYNPPDVQILLQDIGVPVFRTEVQPHLVCEGCHCPAYSASHYALIPRKKLHDAEQAGFMEKPLANFMEK